MSGFFRNANTEDVIRVFTPDGEDWVDLRSDFTKEEINKILLNAPRGEGDISGSLTFIEKFADIAVRGWSNPDPFSIKAYKRLSHGPAQWLDKTLSEHIASTLGAQVEELEKKDES